MTATQSLPAQTSNQPMTLGHAAIDQDHLAFVALCQRMEGADNAEFARLFAELEQHTAEHFERENRLMADYGYPAMAEHRGEHNRVLGELAQFGKRVEAGRVMFGRTYVAEQLPRWFDLHVATMDSALVEFVKRTQAEQ